MKVLQNLGLCLLFVTAMGCDEDVASLTTPAETTDIPIRWRMQPVNGMQQSRALVEADGTKTAEEFLQEACTSDKYERIVIWGDYANVISGQLITQEGFFAAANLAYYGIGADEDSPTGWDYDGEDRYWTLGGKYKFRAYYPKNGVNIVSSSNATTFVFEWNSIQSQTDLLVAYKEIDTRNWKLSDPVPLDMRHALAALKFNFCFVDGYYTEDRLTGCWLENSEEDDFSCVGILAYGGKDVNPEAMTWTEAYAYEPGVEMYKWTYDTGVPLKSEPGVDTDEAATDDDIITIATAYTGGATTGDKYSANDGWLLVIPQELSGNLCLCFTTAKGGSGNVYRAKIPANTGSDGSYKPGYKYNYTVQISKTNLILTLSIAAWNKLDSSYDIKF